jgi:excisionase family DNA binding protein
MKSFIKVKEAVTYYGIGKNIFYNAIHEGTLKAYKPNCRDFLLKVSEIESWIESHPA